MRPVGSVQLSLALDAIARNDFSPQVMAAFLAAGRNEGEATVKALQNLRDHQIKQADAAHQAADRRYQAALWIFAAAAVLLVQPEQQASALEQTASATEQLSGTVQHPAPVATLAM